jgi:Flp pilus assembly protein TadG
MHFWQRLMTSWREGETLKQNLYQIKRSFRLVEKFSNNKIGAILIEFAFAVPILITIIYYVHDLPKCVRIQERMEFVAHEMVNMLQNCSQNRGDKKITKNDIKHAVAGAYLTVFPGKTMYTTSDRTAPLGYVSHGHVYAVRGNGNGTASVLWCIRFHNAYDCPSPSQIVLDLPWNSLVKRLTNSIPSNIYPDLKIQGTELKIIVECTFHYIRVPTCGYKFTDGRLCADVSSKTAFGFLILTPPGISDSIRGGSYFHSVVIFTPKSGLFDGIAPQ